MSIRLLMVISLCLVLTGCGQNLSDSQIKNVVDQCIVQMNERLILPPALIRLGDPNYEPTAEEIEGYRDRFILQRIGEAQLINDTTVQVPVLAIKEDWDNGTVYDTDDYQLIFIFRKTMEGAWVFSDANGMHDVCDDLAYN